MSNKMSRSSQQTTHFSSTATRPNLTQSTSACASQPGAVFTRVIPSSIKCPGVQVGRDSGLGSAVTTELASIKMNESVHHLLSNSGSSGSSASLSCEEHYHTVVELPLQIETGTQSVSGRLSEHQSIAKSSLTSSLSVAEPLPVLKSVPVHQFVAEKQSLMSEQLFSVSSQIDSEGSARASTSSLKYPTQVASASDMCGSLPDNLWTFSVPLASNFSLEAAPSDADLEPYKDELDEIVILPYEYKEEFKEGQFDIVLVYSETDRDEALAFREILIKFISLCDRKPPAICVLDQNAHLSYINSRFSHMEEALRRSTYMFLFLTKEFCGDSWAQLQRDECLMESIHNPEKKWCVVPILTKSRREANYQLPFGLRALKGVEISHMLRGKTLNSVDVNALEPKDVDPFFLKNMTKMLNDRIYLKIQREKQQLVDFQNWLKEEKHRRWKKLQMEKLEKELKELKHIRERQNLQKELEHRKTQEIMVAKAEAANVAEKEAAECIRQLRIIEEARNSERLQPAVHNLVPKTGLMGKQVATKEATTVEYHHHYYGPVSQGPAEQTVYKIYGPVSDSQIGRGNVQQREKEISDHVLLDETNLETDAPESIEYIVETEEAATPFQQDASLETSPVSRSDSLAAEPDHPLEGMAEQKRTAVLSSATGQALALSSSPKSMHLEKDEMTAGEEQSPEVDRPQSPPVLKFEQSMLSHYWQPRGTDLAAGKSGSALGNSRTAQSPTSSGTNMVDAGNSLQGITTSGSFSNDPPVRPMAAVTPIRQKSLPEPNFEEEGEERRLKLPCDGGEEEETKLKSSYLGESASVNAETIVKHTGRDFCDRKRLTIANQPVTKNQETVIVARPEAGLEPVLKSARACTSSVMLEKIVEQVEAHLKPGDVMCEVPGRNDVSGTEQKSKPEVAEGFAGSSSVDVVRSNSQNCDEKQVSIGKDCSNESVFCHRSPDSTASHKATATPAAENKSTCMVS